MTARWDEHCLKLATTHAFASKDPAKKVGAVIIGPDKEPRSDGFNGFPRGIDDSRARLRNRDIKLPLMIHAELNAIINAARMGISTKGATIYVACVEGRAIHGCPPCTPCAMAIIQAGIVQVVTMPIKRGSRWTDDAEYAANRLHEAGVVYREVSR